MEQQYNYYKLREHLTAYFEKGIMAGFQAARIDLEKVKNATDEELVELAKLEDFDLDEYVD